MNTGKESQFYWRNFAGRPAILVDKTLYNGNFIWVDSGDARADNNTGSNVAPCATYAAAIALATADQGDVIILRPGHAESISAAIALSKAGVLTIGISWGDLRPTFTAITNTTATIIVTGKNCVIKGLRFVCDIASQTEVIDVAADDLTIEENEFLEGSATGLSFITVDTADNDSDRLKVLKNVFYAPTAGNYNQAIEIAKDHDNIQIVGNQIYGDFDEACIQIPADGKDCANIRIVENELSNLQAGQHAIQINSTTCTGRIARNECETDTQATTIDSAACSRFGNTWCDVDGSNDEEAIPVDSAIAGGPDDSIASILTDTGNTLPLAVGTQVRKTVDFTAGGGTGDIGTVALFTVTGAVKFSIIATCSDTVVGAATLECGVAGTTAGIIAQIADATALITGEIWADATPTLKLETVANGELNFVIGDGADIFLTIGAANLTDGTIDFNVIWHKLSDDGNLVAA